MIFPGWIQCCGFPAVLNKVCCRCICKGPSLASVYMFSLRPCQALACTISDVYFRHLHRSVFRWAGEDS